MSAVMMNQRFQREGMKVMLLSPTLMYLDGLIISKQRVHCVHSVVVHVKKVKNAVTSASYSISGNSSGCGDGDGSNNNATEW